MIQNITLIGAGNLATQLALALHKKGINITQVYSRTEKAAKTLAHLVASDYTNNIANIDTKSDCCVFAVSDSALPILLQQLDLKNTNVVHTAGSVKMDVFKNFAANYGVFYPLQTFSKQRKVDFSTIPICVEANNNTFQNMLIALGEKLSETVQIIDSAQREKLHLAAVFACNFSNYMYSLADNVLQDSNLSFDLLKPLICETATKVQQINPKEAQTGPAIRFDKTVINHHLSLLNNHKDMQKIYSFVSDSIFKSNKTK